MSINHHQREINLSDISGNMRAISAGWGFIDDLSKLEADLIRIISRLVSDICAELESGHKAENLSSEIIELQLVRIGELRSFADLCLNYVFVSTKQTNLHYQLAYLSKNAEAVALVLERTMVKK